jgi:hypothetical protein
VRLATHDDQEPHAAEAADERAKRFLRGLVGDGERLAKQTLRPALDAIGEGVFALNVCSGDMKPFTPELAKSLFS